jgi:hypothetical protein
MSTYREKKVIVYRNNSKPLQCILTEVIRAINAAFKKDEAIAAY